MGSIAAEFAQVAAIPGKEGPIGREALVIGDVQLPTNASKQRSGKGADFLARVRKLQTVMTVMFDQYRASEDEPAPEDRGGKAAVVIVRFAPGARETQRPPAVGK